MASTNNSTSQNAINGIVIDTLDTVLNSLTNETADIYSFNSTVDNDNLTTSALMSEQWYDPEERSKLIIVVGVLFGVFVIGLLGIYAQRRVTDTQRRKSESALKKSLKSIFQKRSSQTANGKSVYFRSASSEPGIQFGSTLPSLNDTGFVFDSDHQLLQAADGQIQTQNSADGLSSLNYTASGCSNDDTLQVSVDWGDRSNPSISRDTADPPMHI